MRTSKRQQFIKDLVDEEYGPELTVDEIYNSIDFSRREGYTEFKRRRNMIRIANVFILLICMAITCVVTFKLSYNPSNIEYKTTNILDEEEITYLNDNGYKYYENINQMLVLGNSNIYVILAKKNENINLFVKVCMPEGSKENLKMTINDKIGFTKKEDFQLISTQDINNKKFTFTITYNGVTNEYSFENN